MDLFLKTLSLQFVLLTYIVCGVIAKKLNIISKEGQSSLVSLVVDIMLPIMIFRAFLSMSMDMIRSALLVFLISVFIAIFTYILGKLVYPKAPPEKLSVLRYDTIISNTSFAGIPIARALYGDIGVIYASVYITPMRVVMWTVGLAIFTGQSSTRKETFQKLIKNPNIIATFLGILWCLIGPPLPYFIDTAFAGVSECIAPVSMILIGSVIADIDLRKLFDLYVLRYCFMRLILVPLVAFSVCRLLNFDPVMAGTTLILSAMPAPSTSAMLAGKYGGNMEYASKLLFVSNVFSIITVPVLMLLI